MVERCFKGAKIVDGSAVTFGQSPKAASEMLINKFGKNAAGVVGVQLKSGGGHAFNWDIKDGVVKFFDGQKVSSPINANINGFWKNIKTNDSLTIARLDLAEVIEDAVKELLE